MSKMSSFLRNHHYVWDTGLAGHFTYAPLGKSIKNQLESFIRREFQFYDFKEVDAPLIFRKEVWQRSGHWDKFHDPVIYTKSGKCFRVDKLIEEQFQVDYSALTPEQILGYLNNYNEKLSAEFKPDEKKPDEVPDLLLLPTDGKIQQQSLMMHTNSGSQESALRPETATATYFHWEQLLNENGNLLPVKVFQIGKSFRNEISPRHTLIRGREFTQAEFQVMLPAEMKSDQVLDPELLAQVIQLYDPETKTTSPIPVGALPNSTPYYQSLLGLTYRVFERFGFAQDSLRVRQHSQTEMAFYALDAYDIEVNLKELGWTEIAGIHDRGAHDLRHLKDPPHILEIAIGIDRLIYAILDNLYEEKAVEEGKSMLKLPYYLSPIQVSVLPLVKNKPDIVEQAQAIYRQLKRTFNTEYSEKKSIGKRYLSNAQRGIPYSITIDYDTLDDQTVTVRDRDTEAQERVPIDSLASYLFLRLV